MLLGSRCSITDCLRGTHIIPACTVLSLPTSGHSPEELVPGPAGHELAVQGLDYAGVSRHSEYALLLEGHRLLEVLQAHLNQTGLQPWGGGGVALTAFVMKPSLAKGCEHIPLVFCNQLVHCDTRRPLCTASEE